MGQSVVAVNNALIVTGIATLAEDDPPVPTVANGSDCVMAVGVFAAE